VTAIWQVTIPRVRHKYEFPPAHWECSGSHDPRSWQMVHIWNWECFSNDRGTKWDLFAKPAQESFW
jgi:hypothetical protein